jgi:hypothetical protein
MNQLDRLRLLVEASQRGVAPRTGEGKDIPSWRQTLNNALTYSFVNTNVYLIVDVFKDGEKDTTVSGSASRLSSWLADFQKTSGDARVSVEIKAFSTDRNWSRSKADEV